MKNLVTITALAALVGLFPALAASAQDRPPRPQTAGMIPTGDGGWRQPTMKEALETLERERAPRVGAHDPSVAYRPALCFRRSPGGESPPPETRRTALAIPATRRGAGRGASCTVRSWKKQTAGRGPPAFRGPSPPGNRFRFPTVFRACGGLAPALSVERGRGSG